MRIFVAQSPKYLIGWDKQFVGRLFIPDLASKAQDTFSENMVWGADNGCFTEFKENKFMNMLENIKDGPNGKFVCCPDVVGEFEQTIELFEEWQPKIKEYKQPVALVLQDGATTENIPWDKFDALFIGGSTEWKLGKEAANITKKAKQKNMWVHMGRVNTAKRIKYAISIGIDSIDGMSFSRFHKTHLPKGIEYIKNFSNQQVLVDL